MPAANVKDLLQLSFSSTEKQSRKTESFSKLHAFIHVFSGKLLLQTIDNSYSLKAGDSLLIKKDQLVITTEIPEENQEFRSVTVFFDQQTLLNYSLENKIESQPPCTENSIQVLAKNPVYGSYASSLSVYQQGEANKGLTTLKVKEALMLLLHLEIKTSVLLFDFSTPRKAELQVYMNTYFRFNAGLDQFAYLSGRSLAGFKRDFEKVFHTSPGKWLQERRLKEARHLIQNKRMKILDVYLEVGFEDLSHFSFAFKNAFGKSPRFI